MSTILILIFLTIIAYLIFQRYRGKQEVSTDYLPESFIVLDLETTGLNPEKNEIIEIAAIKFVKGTTTHKTIQSLVTPKRKVPKKITDLTGITQKMVEDEGQSIEEALSELLAFAGDLRLVAFNADFDIAFLQSAAKSLGLPEITNPVSCALKMARRAWPNRKRYRLVDLAADGQIDDGKAHRALEDARRALIIYAATTSILKSHK